MLEECPEEEKPFSLKVLEQVGGVLHTRVVDAKEEGPEIDELVDLVTQLYEANGPRLIRRILDDLEARAPSRDLSYYCSDFIDASVWLSDLRNRDKYGDPVVPKAMTEGRLDVVRVLVKRIWMPREVAQCAWMFHHKHIQAYKDLIDLLGETLKPHTGRVINKWPLEALEYLHTKGFTSTMALDNLHMFLESPLATTDGILFCLKYQMQSLDPKKFGLARDILVNILKRGDSVYEWAWNCPALGLSKDNLRLLVLILYGYVNPCISKAIPWFVARFTPDQHDDIWIHLARVMSPGSLAAAYDSGLRIQDTATASFVCHRLVELCSSLGPLEHLRPLLTHLGTFKIRDDLTVLDIGVKLLHHGQSNLLQELILAGANPFRLGQEWFRLLLREGVPDATMLYRLLPYFELPDERDILHLVEVAAAQGHVQLFRQLQERYPWLQPPLDEVFSARFFPDLESLRQTFREALTH